MTNKPRKPWLAALLTLLTPGLGHVYAGNANRGLVAYLCVLVTVLSYFLGPVTWIPAPANIIASFALGLVCFTYVIYDAVVVARMNRNDCQLRAYNRWYVYLGILIISSFVVQPTIRLFVMRAYVIPAASMAPTLEIGDHVLVKKYSYGVRNPITGTCLFSCAVPRRGDVVVFKFPEDRSKEFIKRSVAGNGDVVEIQNGQLILNGQPISESYISFDEKAASELSLQFRNFGPAKVPEGKYFVLGDARDRSYDSRSWGTLDAADVRGHAYLIYWSWDRELGRVRWERIGKPIT